MLPGIERQPRKKLDPSPEWLLGLLHRWQDEAVRAGRTRFLSMLRSGQFSVISDVHGVVPSAFSYPHPPKADEYARTALGMLLG
jgi:hypothetical protein